MTKKEFLLRKTFKSPMPLQGKEAVKNALIGLQTRLTLETCTLPEDCVISFDYGFTVHRLVEKPDGRKRKT